ncbi:MAG: transporter [Verrucomicrobia bacterium]|nr:transporter [Verrucomicrobiota bacterium]
MKTTPVIICLAASAGLCAGAGDEKPARPVNGIMDNSFLVEEAYNQEAGVVQHIFNGVHSVNRLSGLDDHAWNMSFTQEWPVPDQTHQFSYAVAYSLTETGGQSENGLADVMLNYRFQAFFDEKSLTAFAPRFSLVLPTGNADQGFGTDTLGYQWNLPFSTTVGDRWFVHANAGLTYLPEAGPSPREDLTNYNLGASAIYCVSDRLHLMLEWVGSWNDEVGGTCQFAALISPGVRYAFNFANDSQLVLGVAAPVGLTRHAPDIGMFLYVSFEHFFHQEKSK